MRFFAVGDFGQVKHSAGGHSGIWSAGISGIVHLRSPLMLSKCVYTAKSENSLNYFKDTCHLVLFKVVNCRFVCDRYDSCALPWQCAIDSLNRSIALAAYLKCEDCGHVRVDINVHKRLQLKPIKNPKHEQNHFTPTQMFT